MCREGGREEQGETYLPKQEVREGDVLDCPPPAELGSNWAWLRLLWFGRKGLMRTF